MSKFFQHAPPMTAENTGEPDFELPNFPLAPEDSLDLHGFSVAEAIDAVEDFIHKCRQQNLSHLRIITGKGTGALFFEISRDLDRKKSYGEIFRITRGEGFFLVLLR